MGSSGDKEEAAMARSLALIAVALLLGTSALEPELKALEATEPTEAPPKPWVKTMGDYDPAELPHKDVLKDVNMFDEMFSHATKGELGETVTEACSVATCVAAVKKKVAQMKVKVAKLTGVKKALKSEAKLNAGKEKRVEKGEKPKSLGES